MQARSNESALHLPYAAPPFQTRSSKIETFSPWSRSQNKHSPRENDNLPDLSRLNTIELYAQLRALAVKGKVRECRQITEHLVRERQERPSVTLFAYLILSNVGHEEGAAWRVIEMLEEMDQLGLQPDTGVCHAVLKVLAVHMDHLLRSDVLEWMRTRWLNVTEDGQHDIAAGLFREGLFEQALERLDIMRREGIRPAKWLQDLAAYMLCAAGEIEEASRLMRARMDSGELNISRTLWHTLLDTGSADRHHASTSLVWSTQANTAYLNPSSGVCLNVLTTASRAGDAELATDVFTHLGKRGTAFQKIHYQLLIDCYLTSEIPDLQRALSILSIMTADNLPPSRTETRSLYLLLCKSPPMVAEALGHLRELHAQGRKVPLAALNLLLECHVMQNDLTSAMNIYKQIHKFVPLAEGVKKTFADVETFNFLLKGCRTAEPPDSELASFLISELLALRIKPNALTYDRLILVFIEAGVHSLKLARSAASANTTESAEHRTKGLELLEWAYRHFLDMQAVSRQSPDNEHKESRSNPLWMPRYGTLEKLARELALVGDERCWDVLQAGVDNGDLVEGWALKSAHARKGVETAWEESLRDKEHAANGVDFETEEAENDVQVVGSVA